jgi:hypothetical protein
MKEGTTSKSGRLNGGGRVYERKSSVGGWIDGWVKEGMTQIELWDGWVDKRKKQWRQCCWWRWCVNGRTDSRVDEWTNEERHIHSVSLSL